MLNRFVTILVLVALLVPASFGQAPADRQTAKMKAKLEKIFDDGARAKIDLKDGRKVQGHIAELSQDTFILADDGRSATYTYSDVKKVGRIGPSTSARKWVAVGMLGGLLGLTFLAATQTR